jgi:hypothetical protein
MLRAALVMLAAFAVVHLAGLREDVGVLSGTVTSAPHALAGLAYAASYFAALLLAPPLLAAGLLQRIGSPEGSRAQRSNRIRARSSGTGASRST